MTIAELCAEKASLADAAVVPYLERTGSGRDVVLTDLLADLMHWADREGLTFSEHEQRAYFHYLAEIGGEDES